MGRMSLRAAFLLQFGHDFLSPVSGGEGGKERERERAREGRKGREEGGVGEEGEMDGGRVREREGGAGRDRERERERECARHANGCGYRRWHSCVGGVLHGSAHTRVQVQRASLLCKPS